MIGGAVGRLGRFLVWLRKRFSKQGLILMYHRVDEKDVEPWSVCVTPEHFTEHLEVLQRRNNPMSLRQLIQAQQEGHIPDRAVALTFDDGYANNLYKAKPLLERYDIPATVFVTSGYLGKNQEFWWDELEQILLRPYRLPETLSLGIGGNKHEWTLGAAVDYSEEQHRRDANRTVWEAEPGSRLALYLSIWQQLRVLPDKQVRDVLDEIIAWANVKPTVRQTHRPLTSSEMGWLEQGGLIEVGAHTVTHPLLANRSLTTQRKEIMGGKTELEDILGHSVISFSYPYGNYTAETVALIQEAGFSCACSTVADNVWRNTDLFRLPRFEVKDWGGDEFARRLSKWFQWS